MSESLFWKTGKVRKAPSETALNDQEMVDLLDGVPNILGIENFRPYQHYMSNAMLNNESVLVGAEPGLGKTGAALWFIRRALDLQLGKRALIVAPLNVAKYTWPEEMRVWRFARAMSFSLLTGDDEERTAAARQKTEIHIINRENLVWLKTLYEGKRWPYDILVYDEASRLKSAKKRTGETKRKDGTVTGNRMSEFGALARLRDRFKHRVLLTGTPAPKGLIDLWGPMYIVDGGVRLGTSMTAYKKRWFIEEKYTHRIEPHAHSEAEILGRIKDVMFSLREKDYLTLPDLVVMDRWVQLPPPVAEKYRRLAKTMILQEYDIEAVSEGVLANKLLQLANGSVYDTEKTAHFFHDHKLDELDSIRNEQAGTSLLISYSYQFDVERMMKRFPKFRVFGNDKNDVRDWNRGRIPGLILHAASAGHGLNFQHGSNVAVWYGLQWSLELYQQFNKRLHRSGQKSDKVWLYRILAKGTYDERQAKNLVTNGITQDRIMESLKVLVGDTRKVA